MDFDSTKAQEQVAGRKAMTVLNIAMVGSDELAKSIAKASDQRDVHTYVHKEVGPNGPRILSIIRPAKLPDKIRPLFNALCAARVGMIEIKAIDANLGEVLVAYASAGIKRGIFIINPDSGDWVDEDQVKGLFRQVGLGDWTNFGTDGIELRAALYELMDEISSELESAKEEPLVIPIDQHFNVKGIGLVAIGYVQSGTLKVHDDFLMIPADGPGVVKSLQVMDDDVAQAVAGDRVGIAMRNAKEEHLVSGSLVIHPRIEDKNKGITIPISLDKHEKSKVELTQSPFQRRVLEVGDILHASVDLQFAVGRIESIGDEMVIAWDSPILIRKQNPPTVLLAQLDSKPRIMGSAILNRL
jgi:selenocysteine-specific translation elongation factor